MHIKSILCASAAFSITRLVAFMPADEQHVVVIEGADGQPLRMNKEDFEADQADDGAKQYKLHPDHEQYNTNGEYAGERNEQHPEVLGNTQSATDAKANIINSPANQNTQSLTGPARERADRIAAINFGVAQIKTKFFVVDMNDAGKPVKDLDGIDPKGYKDNKSGWDAVFKVRSEAVTVVPAATDEQANAADDADDTDGDGKENA